MLIMLVMLQVRISEVYQCTAGIPESLLISQIQALSPQQAKTLLEIMTSQGQLEVQATYDAAPAAVPAVFGLKLDREVQVSMPNPSFPLRSLCIPWYK